MTEPVVETADDIRLDVPPAESIDPVQLQRSSLPSVEPPRKLPVMGVPSDREAKLVSAEATRYRARSKYRSWA